MLMLASVISFLLSFVTSIFKRLLLYRIFFFLATLHCKFLSLFHCVVYFMRWSLVLGTEQIKNGYLDNLLNPERI